LVQKRIFFYQIKEKNKNIFWFLFNHNDDNNHDQDEKFRENSNLIEENVKKRTFKLKNKTFK
jgi:hypothetical protein